MKPLVLVPLLGLLLVGCTAATSANSGGTATPEATPSSQGRPATTPIPLTATDWPTYHHDNTRTGLGSQVPPLGTLTAAWTARLDGAVYGQPLVVGDLVLAATENDTVYALSATDGSVRWSRHLGTPQPKSGLPCGDIDPLGITSTMAYDPATGLLFAVAETTGGAHTLAGLDLTTGRLVLSRPVTPPHGVAGIHQQRAALTVLDGYVYVAYGGLYGDCGDYVGAVVAAPTTGLGPLRSYAVPTPREGGIWAPGGGVVHNGTLLYAVGNGESTTDYDHSDSVLALTPQLTLADSFSPAQWVDDNAHDLDIGSSGPAVVGSHVYINGKRGIGYVLDGGRLGGIGGQLSQVTVCPGFGGDAVDGPTVYVPCPDGTRAVDIDATGRASVRWAAAVHAAGSPVVGGGAVWVVDIAGGRLYALDPATGTVRASISVGVAPHFASPTLSGSRAYVGTDTGVAAVDGA
jgi:outer membrane protein assembly factor BamB